MESRNLLTRSPHWPTVGGVIVLFSAFLAGLIASH
jgi:hypothetical protein